MLLQVWEESHEKICKAAQERLENATANSAIICGSVACSLAKRLDSQMKGWSYWTGSAGAVSAAAILVDNIFKEVGECGGLCQ